MNRRVAALLAIVICLTVPVAAWAASPRSRITAQPPSWLAESASPSRGLTPGPSARSALPRTGLSLWPEMLFGCSLLALGAILRLRPE